METPYITAANMTDRFGTAEMTLLAEAGGSTVERACSDASEEAESYVAMQYASPLPNIPSPLVSATCDIARYRLYKDRAPEQVKTRYEAAIKWLSQLACNKVKLTFNPALTADEVEAVNTPVMAAAVGHASGGVFSSSVFDTMPDMDPELRPIGRSGTGF